MSDSASTLADVGALVRERGDRLRALVHKQFLELVPEARGIFPEDLSGAHRELPLAVAWVLEHSLIDEPLPEKITTRVRSLGTDHRRHGFPADTYDSFGEILGSSLAEVIGTDLPTERVTAAQAVITQICQTMKEAATEADFAGVAPAHAAEVSSVERASRSVSIVYLESPTPVDYAPGQVLPVMLPSRRGSWLKLAPALPANQFGQLEFHVSADVPAQRGDYWTIGTALHGFEGDLETRRDVLLVALGTGLAPIKSLLFHLLEQEIRPNVSLIISAKSAADLYDLATFVRLAQANEWLSVTLHVEQSASEPLTIADETIVPVSVPITTLVSGLGMWWGRTVFIGGDKAAVDPVYSALVSAEAYPADIFVSTPEGNDDWLQDRQ
ncbi:hypothetical protein ACXZ66_12450 [Corynebacterium sp. S7]